MMPRPSEVLGVRRVSLICVGLLTLLPALGATKPKPNGDLWSLKPVVRPEVPAGVTASTNPIDAFVAEQYREKGLKPVGPADKLTLLRRVYHDLVGLPPTPAEQEAFLQDTSPDAYEKVVDRLLASEQHGVRYARHWLEVLRDKNAGELPIAAVETVSTAFMGLTVGCAKCHDHFYDPVTQADFYRMKALFDPLVARKVLLAAPQDLFAAGKAQGEAEKRRAPVQAELDALVAPYKKKLYDDRVAMLPDDIRPVILKPEKDRTPAEQKIADDYFPVLRIDGDKIQEIMPPDVRVKYNELQRQLGPAGGGGGGGRRGAASV